MNYIHSDVFNLKNAIDALLVQFPELVTDEILRADTFEAETDIQDILEKLVELAEDARWLAAAIDLRMKELSARGARYSRREEAMRLLIQSVMERADLKKVTLAEATLSVSHRKSTPVILNDEALPDELCKFKRVPDMKKITEAIANGEMPAGVSLSNGRSILTIRRA